MRWRMTVSASATMLSPRVGCRAGCRDDKSFRPFVQELAHALLPAFLAVQEPQLQRLCREIVDGGIVAHIADILDRLLGRANGLWIDLHQPLRQRNGFGPQLRARDG